MSPRVPRFLKNAARVVVDEAVRAASSKMRRRLRAPRARNRRRDDGSPAPDSRTQRRDTKPSPARPPSSAKSSSSSSPEKEVRPRYAPVPNGRPDPGEVVWAWVPYEEDASRGKDRPVLVLEVSGEVVYALQLTSQDHDRDAAQEARAGRYWMDIGTGDWDRQRRPSEVRLNRLLTLPADAVRREGAALDRHVFDRVVAAAAPYH